LFGAPFQGLIVHLGTAPGRRYAASPLQSALGWHGVAPSGRNRRSGAPFASSILPSLRLRLAQRILVRQTFAAAGAGTNRPEAELVRGAGDS